MEQGEVWAYRERKTEPLTPVEYLRQGHGPNRKRVWIRHLNEDMDRYEQAVPPGRLKVLWRKVEDYAAGEKARADFEAASRVTPVMHRALNLVFTATLDDAVLSLDYKEKFGYALLGDLPQVIERSGLPAEDFEFFPPTKIVDVQCDEYYDVMPETVERIARALAARYSAQVLRSIEDQQEDWKAIWQQRVDTYPESVSHVRDEQESRRQTWNLVRTWCAVEELDQWDNLLQARADAAATIHLLNIAIGRLDQFGHRGTARMMREYRDGKPLPENLQPAPVGTDIVPAPPPSVPVVSPRRRNYYRRG